MSTRRCARTCGVTLRHSLTMVGSANESSVILPSASAALFSGAARNAPLVVLRRVIHPLHPEVRRALGARKNSKRLREVAMHAQWRRAPHMPLALAEDLLHLEVLARQPLVLDALLVLGCARAAGARRISQASGDGVGQGQDCARCASAHRRASSWRASKTAWCWTALAPSCRRTPPQRTARCAPQSRRAEQPRARPPQEACGRSCWPS
jgi:hypothetical protein